MIDLNLKPKKEEDTPVGVQILMLLPVLGVLFIAFVRAL
jgi:hypothetical protein